MKRKRGRCWERFVAYVPFVVEAWLDTYVCTYTKGRSACTHQSNVESLHLFSFFALFFLYFSFTLPRAFTISIAVRLCTISRRFVTIYIIRFPLTNVYAIHCPPTIIILVLASTGLPQLRFEHRTETKHRVRSSEILDYSRDWKILRTHPAKLESPVSLLVGAMFSHNWRHLIILWGTMLFY